MGLPDTVLITGASSGVGARLAQRLAAKGRTVVATARSGDRLAALARQATGGRIVPMTLDVADAAAVQAVVTRVEAEIGPIATLVNNAAIFAKADFASQDPGQIGRMIATNLNGTIFCSRAVVPYLLARRAGRIINIASVAGTRGIPNEAVYCATKHGVVGFADALAQELQPHGITVATLCPGGIDTPLWSHTPGDGGQPYPGDVSKALPVNEVCDWIEFAMERPPGTVPKKLIFFPTVEWH
jgi:NAD(P)-dependent dehydrogenase (short-subunit alcohol dehydrogenase family)